MLRLAFLLLSLATSSLGHILDVRIFLSYGICHDIMRTCLETVEHHYFPANITCPFPLASNSTKCSIKQYSSIDECIRYVSDLEDHAFVCVQFHINAAQATDFSRTIHCLYTGPLILPTGLPFGLTPCHLATRGVKYRL